MAQSRTVYNKGRIFLVENLEVCVRKRLKNETVEKLQREGLDLPRCWLIANVITSSALSMDVDDLYILL